MNDSVRKGPKRPGLHEKAAHEGPKTDELVASLVRLAVWEDVGDGDATSMAVVDPEARAIGDLLAKEDGVLSGTRAAEAAIEAVDPDVELELKKKDGDAFRAGEFVLVLRGKARSLLTVERVLVNFMQRLSGVATLTRRFVEAVEGTGVTIVDTRKTTPGFRYLQKEAVRHGGGSNHRLGLYDAFMIKDNHIIAAGGLTAAVEQVRDHGPDLFLVVEARTMEEVREVAALEVDQILLDNMSPEEIGVAIEIIRGIEKDGDLHRAWIEASGGITLETVRAKAVPGVDIISVGALTHSAPSIDLSLDFRFED